MITVERTEADVRVTIPQDALPPKQLNAFLDWLRLADEVKAEWWAANKNRFIPASEQ
jgi:hypothetical protein